MKLEFDDIFTEKYYDLLLMEKEKKAGEDSKIKQMELIRFHDIHKEQIIENNKEELILQTDQGEFTHEGERSFKVKLLIELITNEIAKHSKNFWFIENCLFDIQEDKILILYKDDETKRISISLKSPLTFIAGVKGYSEKKNGMSDALIFLYMNCLT